ncbi:MAG: protein kinase [Deltaproteobacteria bacterium]|nr:protein kinase [Deltaproteobacteria bacterium]
MSPSRLAQYEIRERIGQGGMGVVYRARDTHLGRVVAIKVLPPQVSSDPERRSRFLREAQAAANLNHPNIATVYQFGPAEVTDSEFTGSAASDSTPREVLFLAMEYVEGEDLYTKLQAGPLEARTAVRYAIQISEGLQAAHQAGVVHRDLKPNNIRITHDGRVKLLDFGLAKVREGSLSPTSQSVAGISLQTTKGMLMGTPPYMAPEMLKGEEVDHRSDLFSLGVVLYQMLAGEPPYPAGNLLEYIKALNQSQVTDLRSLRQDLPENLDGIVSRLLEQDPEDRIPSAGQVAGALRAQGGSGPMTPPTLWQRRRAETTRSWRPKGRYPSIIALGLVALVTILVGIWMKSNAPGEVPTKLEVRALENLTDGSVYSDLEKGIPLALLDGIRSSGFQIINSLTSSPEVSRGKPEADGILTGYINRTGNGVNLSLQIEDTKSRVLIWFQSYQGNPEEIPELVLNLREQILAVLSSWKRIGSHRPVQASDFRELGIEQLGEVNLAPEPKRATVLFDLAIQQDPTDFASYAARSNTLQQEAMRTNDKSLLDAAERDASTAIDLAPDESKPRVALGRLLRIQGSYPQALEQLDLAANADPMNAQIFLERSIVHRLSGQPEQALAELARALDIQPDHWDFLNQKGILLWKTNRGAEAREAFLSSAENAPNDRATSRPIANLIGMTLGEGDIQSALEFSNKVPQPILEPGLASNIGTANYSMGNFGAAEQLYRRALELDPTDPALLRNLADVLLRLGKKAAAEQALEDAVSILEDSLQVQPSTERRVWLALYQAKLNQCSKSLPAVEALLEEAHKNPDHIFLVAQTFSLCQKKEAAIQALKSAIQQGFPIPQIRGSDEFESIRKSSEFTALTASE